MPSRLTLICHAPTVAQRHGAFPAGEPTENLTKVSALNWQPPRAQRIVAAPELRTQQTAKALNLSAIIEPELRDCDYGTWGGRDLSTLQAEEPEAITAWLTDPTAAPHGGESITLLMIRVTSWLDTLHETGHTLAVTHSSIIRCAILHALSAPPKSFWRIDIAPLTLTDLRHNGRAWTLRSTGTPLSSSHDE